MKKARPIERMQSLSVHLFYQRQGANLAFFYNVNMAILIWIIRIIVVLAVLLFAFQNSMSVPLRFLTFYGELPLVLWVLAVFAAGVLFGASALIPKLWRQSRQIKQQVKPVSLDGN
jgi:uncharacterized integral membrane protein